MSIVNMSLCLLCAIGITCGQILMKIASTAWNEAGTLLSMSVLFWMVCAFSLYIVASLGWLSMLRLMPLSAAYPFLALSYLLVPIGGYLLFNERLGWTDGAASFLIMAGVCVAAFGRTSQP